MAVQDEILGILGSLQNVQDPEAKKAFGAIVDLLARQTTGAGRIAASDAATVNKIKLAEAQQNLKQGASNFSLKIEDQQRKQRLATNIRAAETLIRLGKPGDDQLKDLVMKIRDDGAPEKAFQIAKAAENKIAQNTMKFQSRVSQKIGTSEFSGELPNLIRAAAEGRPGAGLELKVATDTAASQARSNKNVERLTKLLPEEMAPKMTEEMIRTQAASKVAAGEITAEAAAKRATEQIGKVRSKAAFGKGALGAAGIGIAGLLASQVFGGKEKGGPQLDPQQQMLMAMQIQNAQGGGQDDTRQLQNMARILGMLRSLQDMGGLMGQPQQGRSLI